MDRYDYLGRSYTPCKECGNVFINKDGQYAAVCAGSHVDTQYISMTSSLEVAAFLP